MLLEVMLPVTISVPFTPLTFGRRAEPAELLELMDAPCPYYEFRGFLRDLEEVNRVTRGYAPTLAFLDRIVEHRDNSEPLRILDVGSGGGDTLRAISRWAVERNLPVELTGIDLNPHSTRAAREFTAKFAHAPKITFLNADVFAYTPDPAPDVVISALFTHHLSTPEIVRFLRWMESNARVGWLINDLHRSKSAVFWFRFLPVLFGWHHFIQYDGPVSLRRSFVTEDWLHMLAQANITSATIESHPMNRLCVAHIFEVGGRE